jgi:hypothetical protein
MTQASDQTTVYTRPTCLLLAALVAIALSACSLAGPSRESLSQEAEALLRFEGSVELIANGGHDAEQTPEGPLPALAWREYGVDASWDEVVAYFDAELRDRGWSTGGSTSGFASTGEYAAEAWHRHERILRLGHQRNRSIDVPGSFITIYQVTLIGKGVKTD